MEELISIVMPVKNAEKYLASCIESILNQTVQNWELIAVNDHSSDQSNKILNGFASKHNRVKVFQNKDKGIIPALQMAYKHSKGLKITRMDADDVMTAAKLEILSKNLSIKGKGHIAVGGVLYFSENGIGDGYLKYQNWLNSLTSKGDNFTEIYKECSIPSPNWMMWRSDFDKCGAFDSEVYPEDYDLCFRMYKEDISVIPCDEITLQWRDYGERSSRTLKEYSDQSFLDLKLKYFLDLDLDKEKKLVIWGAGKKGKRAASYFINKGVLFIWVCNNPKKIGKHIYEVEMQRFDSLDKNEAYQIMVFVANEDDQDQIRSLKSTFSIETETYFFC